jgi:isopropylmalate/homocitrate/citramalate synthase
MRKNLPPRLPERVFIWDETLREGVQTPMVFLTYVEKVKLAKMLDEIGVSTITVGSPSVSEEEKNNVRRIVNEGFQQASLAAAARPSRNDVDTCLECGVKEIELATPFNELNLRFRLKMTKEQVLRSTTDSVEYAKRHGIKVSFKLEDASRTQVDDIVQIFHAAIKAGAERLVVADSLGFLRPLSARYLLLHIREGFEEHRVKAVPIGVSCHNDFGLATANSLAAVEEGSVFLQTCAAGFGQRSGVAPIEEVVTVLELLYNIDTGLELDKIYRLSQLAEKTFALPIQFHKPIIGENSFAYEMTEQIEEMLTQPMIFEPFPPEIVGRQATFFIGKQTTRNMVAKRLTQAGIRASPLQIDEIVRAVRRIHETADKGEAQMIFYQIKKLLKDLRRGLTEEELWRIVEQVTRQKPKLPEQESADST